MDSFQSAIRSTQILVIDGDQVGRRLDNFLFRHCPRVPRSHVYRILRRGEVRVNSGRRRAAYRLANGDRVRLPPLRITSSRRIPRRSRLHSCILFENQDFIAVDKPAGLAVHGGSGCEGGLIESFRLLRPELTGLDLAHRLDRDTSGCLLLTKRNSALRELHALFRAGQVEKHYLALLCGSLGAETRSVSAPLERGHLRSGERVARVIPEGRESVTEFRGLENFCVDGQEYTFAEVRPLTGRMHQIRVHARHLGCAVAGDEKYGSREQNQHCAQIGLRRLFLHARSICFEENGNPFEIYAALPKKLQQFLTILRTQNEYARINRDT